MKPASEQVARLLDAERRQSPIAPLSDELSLDIEAAYALQDYVVASKIKGGDHVVGAKLGLTSRAKQATMGVDQVCAGQLLRSHQLDADGAVPIGELIQPRVEPEIAFAIDRTLAGPGVSLAEARRAIGGVMCALEIIDSRFADYRFTLEDVVADNSSAARFAVGTRFIPLDAVPDLGLVACMLEVNGELVDTAAGAAVLGDPVAALVELAGVLAKRGRSIEAGWIVLTGGLCDAVPLAPGAIVQATFGHLGSIVVRGV